MQQNGADRILKSKYQQLLRCWSKNNGPCIICGGGVVTEKDHLPPKVLFPRRLRNPKTEFFTFPVCTPCNRISSDEDFLFSVLLSIGLNQESIRNNQEPSDPDLLALYNQALGHIEDPDKAEYRQKLLKKYIGMEPKTGRTAINARALPMQHTLTKIVKSIYWLHTDGHILQKYNPGWWIRADIDTSKINFIENHLKISRADIYWEGRFISHCQFSHPQDDVGGVIVCSLHFYTQRKIGQGMSWYIIALPKNTMLNGTSLYELGVTSYGAATIKPQE